MQYQIPKGSQGFRILGIVTESPDKPSQREIEAYPNPIILGSVLEAHAWVTMARGYYDSEFERVWLWTFHNGPYVPGLWKCFVASGPSDWRSPVDDRIELWERFIRSKRDSEEQAKEAKQQESRDRRKRGAKPATREQMASDSIVSMRST